MGQTKQFKSRKYLPRYGANAAAFNLSARENIVRAVVFWGFVASLVLAFMIVATSLAQAEDSAQNSANPPLRVMLYGDSLLAGYGLADEHTVATKLSAALSEKGQDVDIINASVSGDTTAGGVSRLGWALSDNPDLVILALGGNDILRAIDPANTRENMTIMMDRFAAEGVPVLIAGMLAPKSLGPEYAAAFDTIYPELAEQHEAGYYPFLLEGVAGDRSMNQNDGIHPNPAGVDRIVAGLTPVLVEMLEDLAQSGS